MAERQVRTVDVINFYNKLKKHCTKINGNCRECCFLNLCYPAKCEMTEDILREAIRLLEACADNAEGISS